MESIVFVNSIDEDMLVLKKSMDLITQCCPAVIFVSGKVFLEIEVSDAGNTILAAVIFVVFFKIDADSDGGI
jgi:hypothetical protein